MFTFLVNRGLTWDSVGWFGSPVLPWQPGNHTATSFMRQLQNNIVNAQY